MDELAKTEARNYLCATGFFLIAAWFISFTPVHPCTGTISYNVGQVP